MGEGGGEGAGGILLKAAQKGVAVLRFPEGGKRGEEGVARQHCKWVIQKTNVSYGVIH